MILKRVKIMMMKINDGEQNKQDGRADMRVNESDSAGLTRPEHHSYRTFYWRVQLLMQEMMMMMLEMMQMLGQLVLAHWSCIWLLSNVNSASASKRIRYNMEHRSLTQTPTSASAPVSASG